MSADDLALVRRSRDGDREAFEALVARYQTPVYRLALRMVHRPEDAEDVAQEAFLKAYLALPSFREEADFRTWLFRIASNHCLDRLRRRRRELADAGAVEAGLHRGSTAVDEGPLQRLLRRERREDLADAVASLPPRYRIAVVLHYVQGLTYREIGGVLGLPLKTVETRLYRAKALLRTRLSPPGGSVEGGGVP